MDARPKGLVSERSESMAKGLGTTILILYFLCSCTIHQTINVTIMSKNNLYNFRKYKTSKGLKMDSTSQTIEDDSLSVKDMLERHVQGLIDPSEYKDSQYDPEDTDHDTDLRHRQQKTELDALVYAEEHGMTQKEIEAHLQAQHDAQLPLEDKTTKEQVEDVKTPLNDSTENSE